MKILYVEDNDDNVYMLKNRLSRAGFTVIVATDGAQASPWRPPSSLTSFSWTHAT
jgi:CheY-like chemotaxis protein